MAKQPRTQISGKEARYILKQNSVNLAWLSEQLGISPQALNSRLNADVFSRSNMVEINNVLKKDVFGIGEKPVDVLLAGTIPIYDLRLSAGLGISLEVLEYCIGQSMKSDRPIFNYLKVMRRHADEAIRKIIDALNEKGDAAAPPEPT